MPPKNNNNNNNNNNSRNQDAAQGLERIIANNSLLASEDERQHTSSSLYNDHAARIMSNLSSVRDKTRISAYNAAFQNSLPGKNVLFIGCGIGLLPMMCARAGAKSVVGLDSSSILHVSEIIAAKNGLKNITFLSGKLREGNVKLPLEKFDAIVCEWMGSFITNDNLFEEMAYAVKHHLAEGGIVLPDTAKLHVVALSDYNYRSEMLDYWDNVYGFQMHPMRPLVLHEASSGNIPRDCIVVKNPSLVHEFRIPTTQNVNNDDDSKKSILDSRTFTSDFKLTIDQKCSLHFLTFYLSASFTDTQKPRGNFILPFSLGHGQNCNSCFQEVSLTLKEPIPVYEKDVVVGTLTVRPIRHQFTELELTCKVNNAAVGDFELKEKYVFQY